MSPHLIDFDGMIIVDAELKLTVDNIIGHFARDYGIFAWFKFIPKVNLPAKFKFDVFNCGLFNIELFQHLLLISEIKAQH